MVGSLGQVQVALCLLTLASSMTLVNCIQASSVAQQNFQEDFQRIFESQLDLIENQNIGCLFDKDVCSLGDSCLDDGLFGTCIAAYSDVSFTFRLPPGLLQDLKGILATLVALNYSWHDRYTQCCVRAALISASMEIPTDLAVCQEFALAHRSPPSAGINIRQLLRRLLSQETKRAAGDYEQMKRLELLNRKKYEYFLDIPEKKPVARPRPQLQEAPRRSTAGLEAEDEAEDEQHREAAWSEIERMLDWGHRRRATDEGDVDRDDEDRAAGSEKKRLENWRHHALEVGGRPRGSGSDGDSSEGVNILKAAAPLPAVSAIESSNRESPAAPDDEEAAAASLEDGPPRRMAVEEKVMKDEQEDDEEEKLQQLLPPPPPPPPKRRQQQQQQPQTDSSSSSSVESLVSQLSKRQADPAFIDGRFLWVQFVQPGSVAASEIASFISRLNNLSGRRLLSDRFSVNATNNEVYFELAPSAKPGEIRSLLENRTTADVLKAAGRFAWTSYGFGRPQNRVGASELGGGGDLSDRARLTSTLLVCGLVLVMIGALFAVFLVQRVRSSRKKLREIGGGGPGGSGSADYRDLCRQRMLQKSSEQREPVSAAAQQIAAARPAVGAASDSPNSSTGSWSDDPITTDMDITTGHLILSYMEEYLSNKEKLEQEWTNLCTYEADQSASAAGAAAENAAKNRYPDLLPYDHSRVVLSKDLNATNSDYINASCISDSDPKVKSYILAQAPTEATAGDFWQMLWECGTVTVVNLTRLTSLDGARELCSQYWPGEGSKLFNRFEVHLVSEHIWCEDFVVRNFYLKNLSTGEARTVTMFHFLAWEEDGLPPSAKALLDFRRKVNKSYKGRSSPLVIQCNDGSGRAGTYCLLDLALNRINKGVKEIDLAANLEHLRDQRPGLVKTKDQFEFVVTAIAEEVNNVLKTLPQ